MNPRSWLTRAAVPVLAVAAGLVLLTAPSWAQQTGTIEGQVTASSTGQPLQGAQVTVVGTTIGATTDASGRYQLTNVPAGSHQIRVLAIGYAQGTVSLTLTAGTTGVANLQLSTSVLRLDEVVVTGTAGESRKREIGNSIAQIDVGAIRAPPPSVELMLQNRAVGMQIMQTTAMSGSGTQIRLRGAISVSQSNQPLVYIDGVRVRSEGYRRNRPPVGFRGRGGNVQASPLMDINPADIERVEVIKGAAASTLYGTEAAAGVIQIFTKRGRSGAPQWSVQLDGGFANVRPFGTDQNPFLNLKPCAEGVSCSDLWSSNEVRGSCGDESVETLDPQCSWLRDPWRFKGSGSVGGGTGPFQYFLSGSYWNYDGALPNDNEQAGTGRLNLTFDLMDELRLDVNTVYTINNFENTAAGNNAHGLTLNVYRAERNYFGDNDPNNLRQLLNQEISTGIQRFVGGSTIHYTPWDFFTNRFTFGYDFAVQENRNLRPFGFVRAPLGILSDEQMQFSILTLDYVGTVNWDFSDNITSSFSFGAQSITDDFTRTTAYGEDFPAPGLNTVSNAALFIAREERLKSVNWGFFFQDVLGFADKYFLTLGVRFDRNSAFGEALGLQAYPKGQISWVASDENFFPEALGEMKVRGALGWSGRAPAEFDADRVWTALASDFETSFGPDRVGNLDVGPEKTREIEVGLDWAFLDGRVATEFTWYEQRTTDALLNVRQIPSNGFLNSQRFNVGAIRNRGIEGTLNLILVDANDWGFDLGGSVYTNHTLVQDLGGAPPFGAGNGWVEEGFEVFSANGLLVRNKSEVAAPDSGCFDQCNVSNDYLFGSQQPSTVFGQNFTFRFPKGITLSGRGEYQSGAFIEDGASQAGLSRSVLWPTCAGAYDSSDMLKPIDQLTAMERLECVAADQDGRVEWYKRDFWKLRDLTLTVPFGQYFRAFDQAFFTFSVQNYFRWINSDLRMFDPEMAARNSVSTESDNDGRVVESGQNGWIAEHVPSPAIFTFSLRFVI